MGAKADAVELISKNPIWGLEILTTYVSSKGSMIFKSEATIFNHKDDTIGYNTESGEFGSEKEAINEACRLVLEAYNNDDLRVSEDYTSSSDGGNSEDSYLGEFNPDKFFALLKKGHTGNTLSYLNDLEWAVGKKTLEKRKGEKTTLKLAIEGKGYKGNGNAPGNPKAKRLAAIQLIDRIKGAYEE